MAKSPIDDDQPTTKGKSIFAKVAGWLHLQDDHPLLPLSVIRYVPVSVLLNFLGVIVLVTLGFGTLRDAFLTNVPLNGLIIIIMMYKNLMKTLLLYTLIILMVMKKILIMTKKKITLRKIQTTSI